MIVRAGQSLQLLSDWSWQFSPVVAVSVLLGTTAAAVTAGIRYRYSTEHAVFFLAAVVLGILSPLANRIARIEPWYVLGSFTVGFGVGVLADYLYVVITGESTGVKAFRTVAASWLSALRDRRRRMRRRLESILDRKTVIAVIVGMPLSEFVKVTVVRVFAARPIDWQLAWAHLTLVIFGLAIGVHWSRIKSAAGELGDQAEEVVDDGDA